MKEHRNMIWGWAVAAGLVVFLVLWRTFHLHSWLAVLLAVTAVLLAVILASMGGTGNTASTAPKSAPATPESKRQAAPPPAPAEASGIATPAMPPPLRGSRTGVQRSRSMRTAARAPVGPVKLTAKTPIIPFEEPPPPPPPPVTRPKAAKAKAPKTAKSQVAVTPDDLKQIRGVGPKIEKLLNDHGITTFAQIAKWKKADIARFDDLINGPARIEKDDWITQAKALAAGDEPALAGPAKKGNLR